MRRALASIVLALCAVPALAADDFTIEGDLIRVSSIGHDVWLPVPAWAHREGQPDPALLQLVRNPFADDVETLEFIPADENIESWTKMIAAMVVTRPGYSAAAHEDSIVTAFSQGCDNAALQMGVVAKAEANMPQVFLVACGAYASAGSVASTGGAGEVFLGSIAETPSGAIKFYQEWRGPAFSPDNAAGWPVAGPELGQAILDFHSRVAAEVR